jgi:hypothetical protein
VSQSAVIQRAKRHGWVRLVGTKRLRPGPRPRTPGEPKAKRATVDEVRRREIVRRLLEALDKRLIYLEKRMALDEESGDLAQSAADAERDARTLSGLARLYAKLVELDDRASSKGEPDRNKSVTKPEATDDADRFRRDLALRLQRLNQARHA